MKRPLLLSSALLTTIFLSAAQAADYHVLHDFDVSDGTNPNGNLVLDRSGNLYGTTPVGGAFANGTIFKLSAEGEFSVLHAFTGGPDGRDSEAGLTIDPSTGDLYGTTTGGGSTGWGGVFRLTSAGQFSVLHDFNPDTDGDNPVATLIRDRRGYFYGTTNQDGTPGGGTVFEIAPDGTFHVLHGFGGANGSEPLGRLEQHGATLYGIATAGGSGSGTIFKTKLDGTFTVLANPNIGVGLSGGLARDDAGNLYGASSWDHGSVYALSRRGTLSMLHAFTGGADGLFPTGDMLLANSGKLYGAANRGGIGDNGTLFKLDLQGHFALLHSFVGTDGNQPNGGLTKGKHGTLYGTTLRGGSHGYGVIFSVTTR